MNTQDKINKIKDICKCSVNIFINGHKDTYDGDILQYLKGTNDDEDLSQEIIDEMFRTDTIIKIIAYPNTPIGSYHILHYDLDKALDELLIELFKK